MFKESPVRITDSRDKANPGELPPLDTSWRWKIAGIITSAVFVFSLMVFVLNRLTWIAQNTFSPFERNAVTVFQYVVILFPFIIIAFLVYGVMQWLSAKTKKEKIFNVLHAQASVDMFDDPRFVAEFFNRMTNGMFDVEKTRAGTVVAPSALNYAPTNTSNNTSNSTSVGDSAPIPKKLPNGAQELEMLDLENK